MEVFCLALIINGGISLCIFRLAYLRNHSLTPVKKIIDELKIRASFGASGIKNIDNYQAFGLLFTVQCCNHNKVTPGYTQISRK